MGMSVLEQMTQALSIPAVTLPPQSLAASTVTVGPVSMKNFRRLMAEVSVGILGTNANVQAYLQSCNTNNGSFANISSTNAVVTASSSNTELTLEVRADQLPSTGNQFVQLQVTVNANASLVAAKLLGGA